MNTSLFGTDGIRALVGTDCFTDENLIHLGHAIGAWISQVYGNNATILIGHDTRNSCSWIKHTLIAALNRHGHNTYDGNVLSTPAVCWLTTHAGDFDCGIIISASHNAWNYNGIKIYDAKKGKIEQSDEELITHYFYNQTIPPFQTKKIASNNVYDHGITLYKKSIVAHFKPLFLQGITIVLDCAHGATSFTADEIFAQCGATVIMINNKPDGFNINKHCGALYPEVLQQHVIAHNAHIGFSFDGDGDRVIAVNTQGIIKDGDDILALLATHPLYKNTHTIVSTSMANYGLEHHLQNRDITLMRTDVGDKYVTAALKKDKLLLGGEQSGHIIMSDFLYTGDGIFTALRIIETMLMNNNMLCETFEKYPQVLINVPITFKKDIMSEEMQLLLNTYHAKLDKGRIIVRYSGTEPLLRVMVEGADTKTSYDLATQLAQQYHNLLSR